MVIFTVTSLKYFPKSVIMAKSVKEKMPNVTVCVCLVEETSHIFVDQCPYIDQVILAKDIGDNDFYRNIFKYTDLEAITSVKAQLFLYLMDYYQEEEIFIFLDSDTKIYSPFEELETAFNRAPIIITPHLLMDEDSRYAIEDNEIVTLVYGVYNTAFVGIKRSTEGKQFLDWWDKKLKHECFNYPNQGIFVDQRWIDLAVCYFNIHILKHPGYNVAAWNLSTRNITQDSFNYLVNGEALRFFHFSGTSNGRLEYVLQTYIPNKSEPIYNLVNSYIQELNTIEKEYLFYGKSWSYDYFTDGTPIEPLSRIKFKEGINSLYHFRNPFTKNNKTFLQK
jgi:hypothetical protein